MQDRSNSTLISQALQCEVSSTKFSFWSSTTCSESLQRYVTPSRTRPFHGKDFRISTGHAMSRCIVENRDANECVADRGMRRKSTIFVIHACSSKRAAL